MAEILEEMDDNHDGVIDKGEFIMLIHYTYTLYLYTILIHYTHTLRDATHYKGEFVQFMMEDIAGLSGDAELEDSMRALKKQRPNRVRPVASYYMRGGTMKRLDMEETGAGMTAC
jgi:hypothetical protein